MGVRVVFPDMGKDPSVQLIEKTITENGTYDALTDGANGYSKVNVNVEGGGGSSDFSTANVTIHILQGAPGFSGIFILPTDVPSHPYYMASGSQNFNDGDIIQCVMYDGEGVIDIFLAGASSATGTGNVELETENDSAYATITGDCTITIS